MPFHAQNTQQIRIRRKLYQHKSFCAHKYNTMFRLITHIKETRLIKNSHKEYWPAKIFFNCRNHMLQWSSLKLMRSSVESFNLFCSFFKQMKSVIPNKVPCPLAKQRRFSLTENMSLSSISSSLHSKSYLESPEKKLSFPIKTTVSISPMYKSNPESLSH